MYSRGCAGFSLSGQRVVVAALFILVLVFGAVPAASALTNLKQPVPVNPAVLDNVGTMSPCQAPCACMLSNDADLKWGAGNYVTCSNAPCELVSMAGGELKVPKFCYRHKQQVVIVTTTTPVPEYQPPVAVQLQDPVKVQAREPVPVKPVNPNVVEPVGPQVVAPRQQAADNKIPAGSGPQVNRTSAWDGLCHYDPALSSCTGLCPVTGTVCQQVNESACSDVPGTVRCGCVNARGPLSRMVSGAPAGLWKIAPNPVSKEGGGDIVTTIISFITLFMTQKPGSVDTGMEESGYTSPTDTHPSGICPQDLIRTALVYGDDQSNFIDITDQNGRQESRFSWETVDPRVSSAVWQVSILDFPQDRTEYKNVTGLVAQGPLRGDERTFTLDFSTFNPSRTDVVNYWMGRPSFLKFSKDSLLQIRTQYLSSSSSGNTQGITRSIDQDVKTLDSKLAAFHPEYTFTYKPGVLAQISAPVQPFRMLSKQDLMKTLPQSQRMYHVRVIPLDKFGNFTGNPSNSLPVTIGNPHTSAITAGAIHILQSSTGDRDTAVSGYTVEDNTYNEAGDIKIPWTRNSPWWFAYGTTWTNFSHAEWQVSPVPFDQLSSDIQDPQITARGNLDTSFADPEMLNITEDSTRYVFLNKQNSGMTIHRFPIDFPAFATPYDPDNDIETTYYLRVIGIVKTAPGAREVYSSPQMVLKWGPASKNTLKICRPPQIISIHYSVPDVEIIEYTPIRPSRDPNRCIGMVTTGVEYYRDVLHYPEEAVKIIAGNAQYGDPRDLCPGEKSWYDEAWETLEGFVGSLMSMVDAVSNTWNALKAAVVNALAAFCPDSIEKECGVIIKAGLDAGLAAMGVPPTIPNADQLMDKGVAYLAATVAEETGVPGTGELSEAVLGEMVDTFKYKPNPDDALGIQVNPEFQYQDATILLKVTNYGNTLTYPAEISIRDYAPAAEKGAPHSLWIFPNNGIIAIPSLNKSESITIPLVLQKNDWYGMTCTGVYQGYSWQCTDADMGGENPLWRTEYEKGTTFEYDIRMNPDILQNLTKREIFHALQSDVFSGTDTQNSDDTYWECGFPKYVVSDNCLTTGGKACNHEQNRDQQVRISTSQEWKKDS